MEELGEGVTLGSWEGRWWGTGVVGVGVGRREAEEEVFVEGEGWAKGEV